jgi:hexokinase
MKKDVKKDEVGKNDTKVTTDLRSEKVREYFVYTVCKECSLYIVKHRCEHYVTCLFANWQD